MRRRWTTLTAVLVSLMLPIAALAKVPYIANYYCGSMNDTKLGYLPLFLTVDQTGNMLSGNWTDDEGDTGHINGHVRKDDTVSANLKINDAACHGVFRGQWVQLQNKMAIFGNYIWVGKACQPQDGGTFLVDTKECTD
jgi:hypothetical protein